MSGDSHLDALAADETISVPQPTLLLTYETLTPHLFATEPATSKSNHHDISPHVKRS